MSLVDRLQTLLNDYSAEEGADEVTGEFNESIDRLQSALESRNANRAASEFSSQMTALLDDHPEPEDFTGTFESSIDAANESLEEASGTSTGEEVATALNGFTERVKGMSVSDSVKEAVSGFKDSVRNMLPSAIVGKQLADGVKEAASQDLDTQEDVSSRLDNALNALEGNFGNFGDAINTIKKINERTEGSRPFEDTEAVVRELEAFLSKSESLAASLAEGKITAENAQAQFDAASNKAADVIENAAVAEGTSNEALEMVAKRLRDTAGVELDNLARKFDQVTDLAQVMEQEVREVTQGFDEISGLLGATAIQGQAEALRNTMSGIFSIVTKFSPVFLALAAPLAVVAGFAFEMNSNMSNFRDQTGASVERSRQLAETTRSISDELAMMGVNQEEALQITTAMQDRYGSMEQAASAMGTTQRQLLTDTAAVSEGFRVGAEEAAQLQMSVGEMAQQMDGTANQTFAMVKGMSDAADVAPQAVINDIADNAERLANFSANNAENIARAAVEARALGVSLENTLEFQESTLDNISGQVQNLQTANVQIGGGLDTSRLVQAASMSTEDAQQTILEEVEGIDLSSLNVFQRRSLDQALPGFSVEDIERMQEAKDSLSGIEGQTSAIADKVGSGEVSLEEAMSLDGDTTDVFEELSRKFQAMYYQVSKELGPALLNLTESIMPALSVGIDVIGVVLRGLTGAFKGLTSLLQGEFAGTWQTVGGIIMGGAVAFYAVQKAMVAARVASVLLSGKFGLLAAKSKIAAAAQSLLGTSSSTAAGAMQKSSKATKKASMSFASMAGAAVVIASIAASVYMLAEAADTFASIEGNFTQAIVGIAAATAILVAGFGAVAGIMTVLSPTFPVMVAGAAIMAAMAGSVYILASAAKVLAEAFVMLGPVWTSFVEGLVRLTTEIPLGRIGALAYELGILGGALTAFAAGSAIAGITSLFGGGLMDQLKELASLSTPLETVAQSIDRIAVAMQRLNDVNTEGVEEAVNTVSGQVPDTVRAETVQTTGTPATQQQQQQGTTTQQQDTAAETTESSSMREVLVMLLEEQRRMNEAIANGEIALYLDKRKVNRALNTNTGSITGG